MVCRRKQLAKYALAGTDSAIEPKNMTVSESPVQTGYGEYGGEGGIRTHGALAGTPHFECGAFDHSATSPLCWSAQLRAGCLIAAKNQAGKGRNASLHILLP